MGACIQCRERVCTTAFHVSCIRKHSHLLGVQELSDEESDGEKDLAPGMSLNWAYCDKHIKVAPFRFAIILPIVLITDSW